ncbi:hypothetical protein M9Y10_009079 [Tritrichomonas musculus]|uniref:C2 domain-containing protein n=1 Tax=Tritrichomonas musculus TaxID=1915356 RepID=A0ABR2J0U0_9EUKA
MELHVKVLEARNVPAGDINGKSDCYVTLSTDRTNNSLLRTDVIKSTLNPVFKDEFTLRIDHVSDVVIVGLFDHDAVTADEQLGVLHFRVHDLNPGLIEDRWWTMVATRKKQNPQIHLITHVVYQGQLGWQPLNLLFIDCFVKIIEGTDIPKMDTSTKSDPYIRITISTDQDQWSSTAVQDNTHDPVWNECFLFWTTNPTQDKLLLRLWDKDISLDDAISSLEIPLAQFQVGKPVENWFEFTPSKKVKNGGKIKLYILLCPKGTQWPEAAKLLPQIAAPDRLTAVGMPEGGYPPQVRNYPPQTYSEPPQ